MQDTFWIVQYDADDPWYGPSFGGLFDSIERARRFAEGTQYSLADALSSVVHTFRWSDDSYLYVHDDFEEGEWYNTGISVREVELNRG